MAEEKSSRVEPVREHQAIQINLEAGSSNPTARPNVSTEIKKAEVSTASSANPRTTSSSRTRTAKSISDGINIELNREDFSISQRKKDFKTIARFYGACVGILGLVSLIPAIVMLVQIQQAEIGATTPRWIYLMMFVGGLHLVYSVFLMQIADWSALWAISILMLVASCVYGMFSAAIMLDAGYGPIVQFLQLSGAQVRSAGIGCLVGLLFSVPTSYMCGREALNWKRAEQKLIEIANKRRQQSPQLS